MYHVAMLTREDDKAAKQYKDNWHYQSFTKFDYDNMLKAGFFDKYDKVDVLHDPTVDSKPDKQKQGTHGTTPPINAGSTVPPVNPDVNKENGSTSEVDEEEDAPEFKPYKSLPAAKKRYEKEFSVAADENATLDELNELLAGKLNAPA